MSDPGPTLRALLLIDQPLVAAVGPRVYIATDPPAGYDPNPIAARPTTTGQAVLMTNRGGGPNATSVLATLTFQGRCYASTEAEARALDACLYAALHDRRRGVIKVARCNVTGQHTQDADTGWHFYLSTWQLTVVIA